MSRDGPVALDESLDACDVSRAWLVWSSAAETALADAFRFVGGPVPDRGLVLGRGSCSYAYCTARRSPLAFDSEECC